MPQSIDMNRIKNIHLVGVGGCGMSAIAKILCQKGYNISGSDVKESANTIRLKDLGVKVYFEHNPVNLRGADLLVYSSAVSMENPEIIEAKTAGIPVLQRAEMLGWILNQSEVSIAVAGTHGKTTTSSMLSCIFEKAGANPTYLIGGEANDVEGNAKLGAGQYVIAEADESDGSFLKLKPTVEVVTNIEEDHLDHYGTLGEILKGFFQFVSAIPEDGFLVINGDHRGNQTLMAQLSNHPRCLTYGFSEQNIYRAVNLRFSGDTSSFELFAAGKNAGEVHLSSPGQQNIQNALAALAVGFECGLDFISMVSALRLFRGARRRFQLIGKVDEIMIIDDYAHHPTEIAATLSAARTGWPDKKIIAVFQPHRFSRTMFLKSEFGTAFADADQVIITDIYSAGEAPLPGISGKTVAEEVFKHKRENVIYIERKEKIPEYLETSLKGNEMVIVLGAGDIYTVGKELFRRLTSKEPITKLQQPNNNQ
jgi:UDP-N-acetylmuramate--alanine ligase